MILPSFISLEQDEARKNLERGIQAIKREIYHLDSLCHDWAAWDDTYEFADHPYHEYIQANLPLSTFRDNNVSLVFICNTEGKVIWGKACDLRTGRTLSLQKFSDDYLPETNLLISPQAHDKPLSELSVSGIFTTEHGFMMIASRPILTSNNEGPVRGSFIMGRFLNEDMVGMLSEQTRVDLQIFSLRKAPLPDRIQNIANRITPANPFLSEEGTDNQLLIYTGFADVNGEMAFIIRSGSSGRISSIGRQTLLCSFISVILAGMAVTLFILILFRRTVLRPVTRLTRHALSVGKTGDLSVRLRMNRRDEIGVLAGEFDRMLDKLEAQAADLVRMNEVLKQDITEKELAEKKLRESEDRYRSFAENFQGIAFQADADFIPLFMHGAVEEITGYAEEDFLSGVPLWLQIVHPEDLPAMLEAFKQMFSMPNYSAQMEYRIIRKNGDLRWLNQFVQNVCDHSGKPVSVQGALYDITERKEMERSLAANEKYYRLLLYSLHEEIIVVDRDHRITDVNKDFLSVSGHSRDAVAGQPCFNVFRGFDALFDRRGNRSPLSQVFETGEPYSCRHEYKTDGGNGVWQDILMSPLTDDSGNVTRVIMAMRDVTKEVQLEGQIRQTHKMEAIGTLAGGIAHDFNNILMTIMMNTEYALKRWEGDPLGREGLDLSLKAIYRAKELVEQILTFSRKSEQKIRPLNISSLVKESLKMLRASLPATIEIREHIIATSDLILGDLTQIQQVIINLCSNAAHAMNEGVGVLTVSLVKEFIHAPFDSIHSDIGPGEYLRLSVRDTGHGITPDIRDRIFDPFFTTKRPGEGTGMGLAVVIGIVRSLGGGVRADSEPGKGAIFDIFLPVADGKKEAHVPDETLSLPVKGCGRLLVVDDEALVLEALEKSLNDFGYEVIARQSSREALELFRRSPDQFDMVLTDQTMPEITGLELAKKLLAIRPDLPVILCTGFDEGSVQRKSEGVGIRQLVMKPVSVLKLSRIIYDML